ncbi:MAG: ferredoxin family 2Fe-2S iron-sulfur cluster binding protein [Rhodospirillaceae bacterium]|nr:ferredoxin family 2Fe-2S iron-sulfur cluster binding protein [Rhodospirillaceae bacterium]
MPKVVFIERNGTRKEFAAKDGTTVLQAAHAAGIDMEGACEGSMACSTCHVLVDEKWFAQLPPASASEEDMLDLTYGVTRASRLGCQITLTADLDGITLRLPQATRNMMD